MRIPILLLLMIFGVTFLTVPVAEAQYRYHVPSLGTADGEPTDPEEALALLDSADLDEEFDHQAPEDEQEAEAWFEALLNLLRELGLLEGESEEAGS